MEGKKKMENPSFLGAGLLWRTVRRRRLSRCLSRLGAAVLASVSLISLASAASAAAPATPSSSAATAGASDQTKGQAAGSCGTLTIWTDATRVPAVKLYAQNHPCVKVKMTVFGYTGDQLQTKIGLFNRQGSGWPDLIWDPRTADAGWLGSERYHYAAVLNKGLVPDSQLSEWALNSLSVCTFNGNVYCLRNDIAANVLWYNAPLMKQFGYSIPKTWAEYQKLGEEVANEHPGYVIGTVGDSYGDAIYFWGSGCPTNELVGDMKLRLDLTSPSCTRVAQLLDPLIKNGSITTLSITSPDFAMKYGDTNHLLMTVGPLWLGLYVLEPNFHPAKATWGAALPLTWPDFTSTGDVGGGIWQVSSHAEPVTQKLAAEAAYWMCSSPIYQKISPAYPAVKSAAEIWLEQINSGGVFANGSEIGEIFYTAAGEIWPGYSFPLFNPGSVWADTVVPQLVDGKSMTSIMPVWQKALENQAQIFGYTVGK
jgi:ABC-type glycerol-3-phosphate transport system substrate-binding protein